MQSLFLIGLLKEKKTKSYGLLYERWYKADKNNKMIHTDNTTLVKDKNAAYVYRAFTHHYMSKPDRRCFVFMFNVKIGQSPSFSNIIKEHERVLGEKHEVFFIFFLNPRGAVFYLIAICNSDEIRKVALFANLLFNGSNTASLFSCVNTISNQVQVSIEDLNQGGLIVVDQHGNKNSLESASLSLVDSWVPFFFECTHFALCEPFSKHQRLDVAAIYTPLYHLCKTPGFAHLSKTADALLYYSTQYKLFKFKLSFQEWWRHRFSVQFYVTHPRNIIYAKLDACGYLYVEFILDDNSMFLEQIITKGFETVDIECSYTYQPRALVDVRRIILGIAFKKKDSSSFSEVTNTLLSMMSAYNAVLVDIGSSNYRHEKVYTLPNKVSRSVWTQDFGNIKKLGDVSTGYGFILPSLRSLFKAKMAEYIGLEYDFNFIKEHRMDFIYIYKHHDPFAQPR